MEHGPNELSAGNQQGFSGDPERPLTRRELRAREALRSEDQMAEELERQMMGIRPISAVEQQANPIEITSPHDETSSEVIEPVREVATEIAPERLVLSRRALRNRQTEASSVLESADIVSTPEVVEAVVETADAPVPGPVLTEPPTVTAPIPAPIEIIPQPVVAEAENAQESTAPAVNAKPQLKRRTKKPKVVTPVSPKRRGAQIFSLVAMAFVAGLAIATSIPANALLSPEDLAYQAEQARLSSLPIGDGQSVEGTGELVTAGRDGVSVTGAQAAPTAGAYAPKKLNVNVPVSNNGMQWPVKEVKISSPFGDRNLFGWYNFHTGLDFDPAYGTPIYAVADGVVSLVENPGPTCGVAIFIEHNVSGTKFTSVYCHMVVDSSPFKAGDTVSKGDLVGNIGLTGITTGPHLHLEIRINDVPVDPYAFLVQHAGKPPNEVRS